MHVVLVSMPWGALERPALGIGLLAESLRARRGVSCEIRYLNMQFADAIGADRYQWITHRLPHIAFAGEWLFTEALYGPDAGRDAAYLEAILRREWNLPELDIAALVEVRGQVGPYLRSMMDDHDWASADVVGFTSTFEQNIASLALAQRLKQRHPALAVAFGGANWEAEMGEELHRRFPFIDICCSGEADLSFPRVVEALRAPKRKRTALLRAIPGLVFRDQGTSVATGSVAPVEAMDTLPVPSYGEYFAAREGSTAAMQITPVLLFEASRGCWWGAKSHCTFCGLNGGAMKYRSKSPGRLIDELRELIRRWPCPTLEAVDNILDMDYFESVLPALEDFDLPGPIFFEIKANLKRHHVAALKRAKIMRIQPGIESLSDHVLKLMRKGTTALRNVQLLKWCREYGISVDWNLLYGFPGETDDDYREIMSLLPRIAHLQMPGACGAIRLDRFSPYFEQPGSFGIRGVRPLPVYQYLYPVAGLRHEQVAYYFRFDYAPEVRPSALGPEAARLADSLRERGGTPPVLQALPCNDGGIHLFDSRDPRRTTSLRLSGYERCILERIDEVASLGQVMVALNARFPQLRFDEAAVRAFLDRLVALGVVVTDGRGLYLGLALMAGSLRSALEQTSRRSTAKRRTIPIVPGPAVATIDA